MSRLDFFFSGSYCTNSTYNISSNIPRIYIAPNRVACFICNLPGQISPDTWQLNGSELAENINAEGCLIVPNPGTLFGGSPMSSELTCGSKKDNTSMTALIGFTGMRI